MKLFFVTYAGGSTSFFNTLALELSNDCKCILIEYAGHTTRSKEPFYESFKDMVNDVTKIVEENLETNEAFSIFGYSMGALVAYEVLMKPIRKGVCHHLFVAAHYPPATLNSHEKYSKMTDEALSEEMGKYGGLDPRIIENKRFLNIYLHIIRKDYQLLEEYIFDKELIQVPCGITVFYSQEDTAYEIMSGWKKYTYMGTSFRKYQGTHFFLRKHQKAIADDIRKVLQNGH